MASVGFIGLGTMGSAMAVRLVEAGHTVLVWNRSRAALDPVLAAGAHEAVSAEEALQTGVALSMLANDRACEAIFTEDLLKRCSGTVHLNMATVSLDTTRTLAARHARANVDYAAAPVLGRPAVAASGQLNIIAAGSRSAIDRADPFFAVLGKHVWRVGNDPTQANLVKIGVNYNLIHTLQALAESVTLVEGGGVDGQLFVDILTDTAYTGSAYTGYGPMIASRTYTPPSFSVGMGLKDLALTQAAAAESATALPSAPVLQAIFEEALRDGDLAELDWSAIAEITRRR